MWSGSIAAIPSGWALCDGSNGTPDLRNRFIVGAGSTYAVGGTGGSADAAVIAHTHSFSGSGSTNTTGAHTHNYTQYGPPSSETGMDWAGLKTSYQVATSSAGSHSHTVSVSGTTGSTGSSGTNANLPPYYALAYILKL